MGNYIQVIHASLQKWMCVIAYFTWHKVKNRAPDFSSQKMSHNTMFFSFFKSIDQWRVAAAKQVRFRDQICNNETEYTTLEEQSSPLLIFADHHTYSTLSCYVCRKYTIILMFVLRFSLLSVVSFSCLVYILILSYNTVLWLLSVRFWNACLCSALGVFPDVIKYF